jgi:hypothetical protein
MAIINSYPSAVPTTVSYVLGVDFEDDGAPTKLFPLQGIVDLVEEQIPAGPQGPQGIQGIQGEQGIPGVSGTYGLFAQTALGPIVTFASGQASLIGVGVGSLSVPANAFQVGDSFVAKMCGYLSCANNEDLHIRVKSDGNVIADTGIFNLNLTTNKYFELVLDFTVTKVGGLGVGELFVNGQFSYNKDSNSSIEGTNFALIDSTDFDTTSANDLSITAEWVTSSTVNKIQSQNFVLTKVY